jgi:hypothetical protein
MPNLSVTSVRLALNVAIFGLMLAWGHCSHAAVE